jgi:hypothetical protein
MTSIYDLLTGVKIEDLKVTSIDNATGRTYVDTATIDFWQGIMTLSHVLKGARTYPHGLPIPETGDVHIETIANGASATVGPSSTSEIWLVQHLNYDNCGGAFIDGDGHLSDLEAAKVTPFYLTSTMKLAFSNASGSEQTPSIAYLKVSL